MYRFYFYFFRAEKVICTHNLKFLTTTLYIVELLLCSDKQNTAYLSIFCSLRKQTLFNSQNNRSFFYLSKNHWIYLDGRLVQKISKRHFFQDIKNSFHGVTQMGLKPHQNFFQFFFQQIWSLEKFKVFVY